MSPMKVPNSNGGGDESEGELSGVESDHSGSSREPEANRDSSEGDEEVDSDDSSEMDEGECEIRRNECTEILADLERQSNVIREQLYQEKVAQVEYQLSEVKSGRSCEYLGPLQALQDNCAIRTEVAGILREMKLTNIKNSFEAEKQAALQNFEVIFVIPIIQLLLNISRILVHNIYRNSRIITKENNNVPFGKSWN